MSEERLQEIKDSVEFQYTLAKAKGYDNALLFTNEEQELVENIKESECCVILTPSTCCVNGTGNEILTLLSILVNQMKEEGFEKQMILDAIEIGFIDRKERSKQLKNLLEELLEKLD